jgi:hypothetical protein
VSDTWRQLRTPADEAAFVAAAAEHRLRPLVGWRLRESGELLRWPAGVRKALVDAERAEAALEVTRRLELSRLLRAFAAAEVPVLVFKGAALAYSLYPEPWLRPREDTDLLVRATDAARAGAVLAAAGYRAAVMQSGALVTQQRLHVWTDAAGRRHACDLHWKIANPAAFADLLSADDLLRQADVVPLGSGHVARAPGSVHALLLACWHRVSHHHDSDDLLWLYDIHLLAGRLSEADAAEFVAVARQTATGTVCVRGLRLAQERFGTRLPAALVAECESLAGADSTLTAIYLEPSARKVDILVSELRALPTWTARLQLVREHLFPPAEYMSGSYGFSSRVLLPGLYLWRIARGAAGWFRRR